MSPSDWLCPTLNGHLSIFQTNVWVSNHASDKNEIYRIKIVYLFYFWRNFTRREIPTNYLSRIDIFKHIQWHIYICNHLLSHLKESSENSWTKHFLQFHKSNSRFKENPKWSEMLFPFINILERMLIWHCNLAFTYFISKFDFFHILIDNIIFFWSLNNTATWHNRLYNQRLHSWRSLMHLPDCIKYELS